MQTNDSCYRVNSEYQPEWLFSEENDVRNSERNSEDKLLEYQMLPRSNMVVISDSFDIFGFHFKSEAPENQLKIMFYNKNGNIIIRYCSGKGRITKIDDGEMVSLPM